MEKTETNKMIGNTPNKKEKDLKYAVKGKKGKKVVKGKKEKKEGKGKKKDIEPIEEPKEEEKEKAIEIIKEVVVQHPQGLSELTLDRGKIDLLKNTIALGATDDELKMFINVCTGMGLSPFLNQVHMVKRWNSKIGREVANIQIGIDGFRSIAENTGAYAGNDDPKMGKEVEIEYTQGKFKNKLIVPDTATVTVYKMVQGAKCDFTATARWKEFYPGDKMGFMWRKMPNVMLGKCAEAQALRKAFPKVLGGVYAPEEMDQAEEKKPLKTPVHIAMAMIGKETCVGNLIDFEKRIKNCDKYTEAQKKELSRVINVRASELDGDA